MTVKEIIEIESANESCINLYKEGIFWRAYNQSAMRLTNHIKSLKLNRKYVKKVEQDILYCGFPDGSLEKIKKMAKEKVFEIIEMGEKKIIIGGIPAKDNYKNWIENQPVYPVKYSNKTIPTANKFSNGLLYEPVVRYTKRNDAVDIISQIQRYPLENATPMETMLFVQKLKQSIKDGPV